MPIELEDELIQQIEVPAGFTDWYINLESVQLELANKVENLLINNVLSEAINLFNDNKYDTGDISTFTAQQHSQTLN